MCTVNHRVGVALSGGADSAAAAITLKRAGYEVLCLTLDMVPGVDGGPAAAAARVASRLGLEHVVIEAREPFRHSVIEPFLDGYLNGVTPNPCVICNRRMKFGLLLDEATRRCCRYLATGHYALLRRGEGVRSKLYRPLDRERDQTYFLWTLDQAVLEKILLPLGGVSRREVEDLVAAEGLGDLPRGSQDICFTGGSSYREFLRDHSAGEPAHGPILDTKGNVIGRHRGLPYYTVGQRKGLMLGEKAAYVLRMIPERNALVVGDPGQLEVRTFRVTELNLLDPGRGSTAIDCLVQTRYRMEAKPALVKILDGCRAVVDCRAAVDAAPPGQSAVFYSADELLGGGVIER